MAVIGPTIAGPNANPIYVTNGGMPANGKVSAVPYSLNFSTSPSYYVDFTISQWQGAITNIQSVYIDNSGNSGLVTFQDNLSGQSISVPAGAQAYLPLIVPNPPTLTISSPAGNSIVNMIFFNVPFPLDVWFPNGSSATVVNGAMQTVDVNIAAIAAGTKTATIAPYAPTLVSHSTTTPVTPASTLLMNANLNRRYLLVQAPTTADLWINPTGGTASVGGADCVRIPSGAMYENSFGIWTNQINYYCASGSLEITAFEG